METITILDVFKGAWGLLVPYLVWLHRKIDKVSEESVRREEYNGTVDSIRKEIRDGNTQITQRLDVFISTILSRNP